MEILAQDILEAYEELGGIEYLQKHPELLQRILLKILAQQDPPPELVIDLSINAPWLDFSSRLRYRDVEDAKVIEQRALSVAPGTLLDAPQGWKAGPPEAGLAAILRDEDKS